MLRSAMRRWLFVSGIILVVYVHAANSQCSESDLTAEESLPVNETVEIFNTPGYRVAYFKNMDCRWIFDAGRDDATIAFEIQELFMETSRNCAFDAIIFYNGNSTSGSQESKLCGRLNAGASGSYVTVVGRYAYLRMKSDRSRQYAGAKIKYFYVVEKSGNACSGTSAAITATLDADYLTSPGFPIGLDNGVTCSWTITCQVGAILRLDVVYSDMEFGEGTCGDQVMSIYDGTSSSDPVLLDSWCDSSQSYPSQATVYYTTDNTAYITLDTMAESTAEKHGFRLNFRQNSTAITTTTVPPTTTTTEIIQVCSPSPTILEANDTWKYFQSLYYPNYYPHNAHCTWRIEAPQGYTVNLTFIDTSVQNEVDCARDSVSVFDGRDNSYPRLASFCDEDTPVLQSTGRYMYVVLRTDATINYRGFNAQYQLMEADLPDCSVTNIYENLTATTQVQNFTSPDYPNNYNDSMTIYWMIHNPNQTQAVAIEVADIRVEASVNCIYDYVKVYNGPCFSYPRLGKFCGYDKPIYYGTGAYTLVVFSTDNDTNYAGFVIKYYLTDIDDDDMSILIITGIVVGSVLGGLALFGLIGFGVYKYYRRGKKRANSSRRSSSSSASSLYEDTRKLQTKKLSDLLQRPKNLYK